MSNLVPLASYLAQRDLVRASLLTSRVEVYPRRDPKPGPVVRPAPTQPTFRPAA